MCIRDRYWNSIHGLALGEAKEDLEGLQTMRTLARNMTFLMKSIAPVSYTHLDVYKRQPMSVGLAYGHSP